VNAVSVADPKAPAPANNLRYVLGNLAKAQSWVNGKWWLRKCTRVGAWTRVWGRLHVVNRGELVIGTRVRLMSQFAASVLFVFRDGRLEIGDRTFINYGADICATKSVVIGSDCLIGTHVIILDNGFHDIERRDIMPPAREVKVGDRVWIGNRVTILPGVTIGDDAVVGAGAVVTSDVEPRTVVAGNPARLIRRITLG
jgi:acetyltransferase-like isoleucine patch superfamily enzyme